MTARSAARCALLGAALLLTAQAPQATAPFVPVVPAQPLVSLVAGNGVPGIANGSAPRASFVQPEGIAVDRSGAIYVADSGAQNIREIRNGSVSTFAGIATRGPTPQAWTGGYADGPVATARFNRPTGIAVANDGTVYVADLLNHCIRKIAGGRVSTLAGSPKAGNADGTGSAASFDLPNGIAVDDDGILYVADYGNGIRRVTPDGVVTTVIVPVNKNVLGVAVTGSKETRSLAYTDTTTIHMFESAAEGLDQYGLDYTHNREPYGANPLTVGHADGIVILSPSVVAVTDVFTNAVRFVRFDIDTGVMTSVLAGGLREGSAPDAGYRDGAPDVSLLDTPLGLARESDGTLVVSDAGNHRIRRISGVDARGPVTHSHVQELFGPAGTYRVAVVGSSFVFHGVTWPESIPGVLEAGLARDGPRLGLTKKPFLSVSRVNASTLSDERDIVDTYFGDGGADLVIFVVSGFGMTEEFMRPEIPDRAHFSKIVPAELRALAQKLAGVGTQMMLVYIPEGEGTSPIVDRARGIVELSGDVQGSDTFLSFRATALEEEQALAQSGIQMLGLEEPMEAFAASPERLPLYFTGDNHATQAGQEWMGNRMLEEIERWKPWTVSSSFTDAPQPPPADVPNPPLASDFQGLVRAAEHQFTRSEGAVEPRAPGVNATYYKLPAGFTGTTDCRIRIDDDPHAAPFATCTAYAGADARAAATTYEGLSAQLSEFARVRFGAAQQSSVTAGSTTVIETRYRVESGIVIRVRRTTSTGTNGAASDLVEIVDESPPHTY